MSCQTVERPEESEILVGKRLRGQKFLIFLKNIHYATQILNKLICIQAIVTLSQRPLIIVTHLVLYNYG